MWPRVCTLCMLPSNYMEWYSPPTSDLRGLPTSLTCTVFINRARSVHNSRKKQLYILSCYTWCNLHRSQFNEACTKSDEKSLLHLPRQRRMLGTACIGCRFRRSLYTVLEKKQLYTYKTCETCLRDSVHISRKNQLRTYLPCENTLQASPFYVL